MFILNPHDESANTHAYLQMIRLWRKHKKKERTSEEILHSAEVESLTRLSIALL